MHQIQLKDGFAWNPWEKDNLTGSTVIANHDTIESAEAELHRALGAAVPMGVEYDADDFRVVHLGCPECGASEGLYLDRAMIWQPDISEWQETGAHGEIECTTCTHRFDAPDYWPMPEN